LSGMARMPLVEGLTGGVGRVELLALGYAADFDLPGTLSLDDVATGALGFYDTYPGEMSGESQRAIFALTQKRAWSRGLLRSTLYGQWRGLTLMENYTGYLIDADNGDRRRQEQQTITAGALIRYKQHLAAGWRWRVGGEWRGDWGQQREEALAMDKDNILAIRRDLDYQQNEVSLFSELCWRPHQSVRVRGGVRGALFHYHLDLEQAGEHLLVTLAPRASVVWQAQRSVTLFASYGHGFRAPEARAFEPRPNTSDVALLRNQPGEARMTLSRNAEVGVHFLPVAQIELRAAGFATFIDRESIFDHVAGTNLERNATRRVGGELQLKVAPWRWLDFRADAALVDARFSGSGEFVPGAPRSMGSVSVRFRRRGLRAVLRLLWLGPRPLAHGAEAASAAIAQITAGWRWRWLELGLQVDNLFDTRWREAEYHFASFWDHSATRSSLPVLHYVAGPPLTALLSVGVRL
ncbi:MAG: TonB-dependent receptor, partial [Deltaproteobacteria bacterium]|nr:TonB-dependent receptor [Deltaproteobacteria bacterium]